MSTSATAQAPLHGRLERATRPRITIADGGYRGIVLDRLARQAVQILDMDESCIVALDQTDSASAIVAAAHGRDEALVGKRVMAGTERSLLRGGAAAPLCWDGDLQGSLTVRKATGAPGSSQPDPAVLEVLARIVGAAVSSAQSRPAAHPDMRAEIAGLMGALNARDGYTARHSQQVVTTARAIGRAMRLGPAEIAELEAAALLHDIGKVTMPDSILNKPGRLTADESAMMAAHPARGAEILMRVHALEAVAAIVRFHHERWDGGGYPDGLWGRRIPLASRIIAVCDSHNAMTSDRPYRNALSQEDALAALRANAGRQFDPDVVTLFDRSSKRQEAA
jgi:putative nucleotidyltransferase with HDIG domain